MDFNKYQLQIKKLASLRNEPDFNLLFDNMLVGVSNSDKFLIKMEVNRLAQPCARIIDLRDKVTEQTTPFIHNNLTHYLTKSSIKVLEDETDLFSTYTIGVYENVLAFVQREKQQIHKVDENTFSEVIQLNSHKIRANARMFFISGITITLSNGEHYKASTSNISTSGLKIKLSHNIPCEKGDSLQVEYTDLGAKYVHNALNKQKITYQLVSKNEEDGTFYFYLHLEAEQDEFVEFLKSFIRGNQYKYKIDVQYYYNLALENALKNSILRVSNTLPIYLNVNNQSPILFMLENQKNEKVVHDWRYNNSNQLAYLFTGQRFTDLLAYCEQHTSTTIYSFTYINKGVEYLLSATEFELQQQGIKQLFIQYGRSKLNFHIYHLTLSPHRYFENSRYEITSSKPSIFSDITHLALITEITTQEVIESPIKTDKKTLNLLNNYVHRGRAAGVTTPVYKLFPAELRKEERYKHTSAIKLRIDGTPYAGKIIDFSLSGLKIQLNQVPTFAKCDMVRIDFMDLQKITKNFRLVGIRYKTVQTSPGKIYHLQVASEKSLKTISTFFKLLVEKNPTHFPVIPLKEPKQPVTERLHEVAESMLNHALFFVNTQGKPCLTYSSIPASATSLNDLFNIENEPNITHNYTALAANNLLEKILSLPLRHAGQKSVDIECTIYIRKYYDNLGRLIVKNYLDEDFASETTKREFILMLKKKQELQILHYRLVSINTPDLSIIESEIAMISRHATHLGSRIQEVLEGIGAIIEIIDRTDQVLTEVSQ